QHHPHPLANRELLQPRLLPLGAASFGLAQVIDNVLALDPLHGRIQHFLLAVRVFVEDCVPLRFAHLLENNLLGKLGGYAAQRAGVAVEPDLAASSAPGASALASSSVIWFSGSSMGSPSATTVL